MPSKSADFNDFCRRWKITHRGLTPWPSRFDPDAMFAIVRKRGNFQLLRIRGVKHADKEMPLTKIDTGAFGQGRRGTPLEGALSAKFNGELYLLTLNELGDNVFEISVSQDSAPLHEHGDSRSRGVMHGGPHGVDS